MFKVNSINDLELLYSVLREEYPDKQIDVTFNYNTKEYTVVVTNRQFKSDPEVPVDLTVEVVYGDTDSTFLSFKYNRDDFDKNREDTFKLATICGDKLTNEVFNRPPIVMEFEKVFQPFILLTKKRYIANKYENMKDPFQLKGIDAKGIALTRRDYSPMVKKCYKEMIDAIVQTTVDIDKSIEIFKRYIEDIHDYNIKIDDLVVSAMLAKTYKSDNLAHVNLAKRLKERKEEAEVGSRIPYIFVEPPLGSKTSTILKKYELAEDPTYAIKNNLKFNRLCYLEQLAKPILGFLKVVLKHQPSLLDELVAHVNEKIVMYGGKSLKPSDFKLE
jgi:DNA polymerase elongation subunit (family B)